MAGLVDAPWNNGASDVNDDDLASAIGAMGIKDLKAFLRERNVTLDASIVEKADLRRLAYQSADVGPPQKRLPPGWDQYESDGKAYYYNPSTGETTWVRPEPEPEPEPEPAAEAAAEAPSAAPEAEGGGDADGGGGEAEASDDAASDEKVDFASLSVKELKLILAANGLSTKGFAEKSDFVKLAADNEGWIQPHLAYQEATVRAGPKPSGAETEAGGAVASTSVNLGPAFDEGKARRAAEAGVVERPVDNGGPIADGGWQIDVFGTKRGRCLDDPSCIRFTPRNMRVNNCGMGSAAVTCMRCGRDNLRHQDLGKWEEGEPHMVNERGEGVRFG